MNTLKDCYILSKMLASLSLQHTRVAQVSIRART